MADNFQLVIDDKELRKYLAKFPDQIRFAQSLVLNETAFDVRRHIVNRVWPRSVNVKVKGFAGRAFTVRKATKRDLLAAVFADPRRISPGAAKSISRPEEGKPHFPFRGRWLAVPSYWALTTRGGKLNKTGRDALAGALDTFVADLRGRGPAIWQRRRKGSPRLLFVLKPRVPTPRIFPFGREADRRARQVWPGKIRKAAIRAVKTAIR